MDKGSFRYILRFAVQPGHHEVERLKELVSFCMKARIDEVMFFIDCEELSQGHLTLEETKPWMELIARGKGLLDALGIATSINPWPTLLHGDRGRTLKEGQNFTLMTDQFGNRAKAVVCPMCGEFRRYITATYGYYASLNPNMIWVEDDFRLHNHGYPLVWGGCFCDAHMEEYSRRAGKLLTRGEFIEGVLKPGKPHPFRKIWLEASRDVMVELAAMIGEAVHSVSPYTRVGLMSSNPPVHCAEGRDWEGILKGLAGDNPMVDRIHLPSYREVAPQVYLWDFSTISRLTRAVVPDSTEIYPELEGFPHSTFMKSRNFTRYQLETSLAVGADGMTLNIFDMMGNGILMDEGYQEVLADTKDFLSAVKRLGLEPGMQKGVKVLCDTKSSYSIHTQNGECMTELYPKENFWAGLLSCYGVANTYSLEKSHKKSIAAVSGQYPRNLSNEELDRLFTDNFVMLDGEAAHTLYDMGRGELAGIKNAKWHPMDSGFAVYEQVCNNKAYCGINEARLSCQAITGDFLEIEYFGAPVLVTDVKDSYNQTVAAGMAVYNTNVFILPYGRFTEMNYSHLNPIRQAIIQQLLKDSGYGWDIVYVEKAPYAAVYLYDQGNQKAVMLCNCTLDAVKEVRIHAPALAALSKMELSKNILVPAAANTYTEGDYIILRSGLAPLETKVLLLR